MENLEACSKSVFEFTTIWKKVLFCTKVLDFRNLDIYVYKFVAVNQFISSIDLKTNIYFSAKHTY